MDWSRIPGLARCPSAAWLAAPTGWLAPLLSRDYLPHRYCYLAEPRLVWTNVIADGLIAAAYVLIFACLFWIAGKLRRLPELRGFIWIFFAFGAFILTCAVTHAMEVVTVWLPFYPLSAALKVVCAAVSVPTAVVFLRVAPTVVYSVSRTFELHAAARQREQDEAANYRGQIEAIDRSQMRCEFAMDGTILGANENYLRVFGYTHAEVEGRQHSMLLAEQDRDTRQYVQLWERLRKGEFQSGLFRRMDKQGREVWLNASYNPVPGADGAPARVVKIASDATEQVRAQRQIKEAEVRLQAILDSVADGIITIDAAGTIVDFNRAAAHMFERRETEAVGRNVKMLMPEPDRGAHDGYLARFQSTGKSKAVGVGRELEGLSKAGRVFPIELTITEMLVQEKRFFVGLVRDITERRQTEKALRDQASLLEMSHDAIIIRDFDGAIRFWNRGAEEMYGYSKQEAVGRVSHEILQTHFAEPLAKIEERLAQSGQWSGELIHVTQDGSHIVVESRWELQSVQDGAPGRVLETNKDITERKHSEEQLLLNVQALTRSNHELDQFAYAASHDLKAPLRVIFNASKWLEEDLEPHLTAETREHMALLRARVVRMEKLLDDLLEYSRIGRETGSAHNEVLDADKLMEDILELIALPPGFAVSPNSSLVGVRVKRTPLQQVLMNLIGNAVKHHDKKTGCIDVSVADLGARLEFAVKDDGPGIPAQFHEQIFKMFQTLKPRDKVEGSGMGLAMVRKHVEHAGGTITVESEEGRGSTFRFTWPKLDAPQGETR